MHIHANRSPYFRRRNQMPMYRSFLSFAVCMCLFTSVAVGRPVDDTTFSKGSGINEVWLHDTKAAEFAHLGMLWGFLKYHHPAATSGSVDMDAELFRMIPEVLASAGKDSSYAVMERWVDRLGTVPPCQKCATYENNAKTYTGPDYAYLFLAEVPQSMREKLDRIRKSRESGKKSYYVRMSASGDEPEFINERSYANNYYPDAGMRLLSLFRYWNIVQYYCPNRQLAARNRGKMLIDMVREFGNAGDTLAYQVACMKLIARINDGHGRLETKDNVSDVYKGIYIAPLRVRYVEDQLVVTGYYKDTLDISKNIKPGDVIEQIDGMGIVDLIRKYLDLVPASNYEAKLTSMVSSSGFMLRGKTTTMKLTISRSGVRSEVTAPRIKVEKWMQKADAGMLQGQGYKVLDGNIGYIYPSRLAVDDLKAIKGAFANVRGIVIDMRCTPAVPILPSYIAWLKTEASPFAKHVKMNADLPGDFEFGEPVQAGGEKGQHFAGKLVVLTDATTHSSAEYQAMALQSVTGARVVGSQTSGANGNTSEIVLPGGLRTWLSGVGVFYPDGTATQVEGLRIDKQVKPTIKGIVAGKDEVLEEGVRMIKE